MTRYAWLIAALILFASCSEPVVQTWSETGRFTISPVQWGNALWTKQNTITMSGPSGKALWTREYTDLKWTRTHNFSGNLIVVGDDRVIERIDISGKTIWRWSAPTRQLVYPFAFGLGNLICALDTDTDYNLNSISIIALNLRDGTVSWSLEDHDYSGAFTLEPLESGISHLVIPTAVGESVFLECFSCHDGKFIWRKNWNKPPSGQHPILASNSSSCVIWRKTQTGVEFGLVDRKTGTIRTSKLDESSSLVRKLYGGGCLFLRFRSGSYRLDPDLSIAKLSGEWFPLCPIPGDDAYLVQNTDCTSLALADKTLSKIRKSIKTDICYTGIPGIGFGEVYLKPTISPLDFKAVRCIAHSKQQQNLALASKVLPGLGKGTQITDLFMILKPLESLP